MSKGILFAHMRLHIKTDQTMDEIFPNLFLHNGTDVDRIGENILGRELSSGKHDVSKFSYCFNIFCLILYQYLSSLN